MVFSAVTDPVAAEIAAADGSPLEHITGTSDEMPMDASFDLIKKIFPDAKKVGILHNTSEVNSDIQLAQAVEVADATGMEVIDRFGFEANWYLMTGLGLLAFVLMLWLRRTLNLQGATVK